MKSSKNLIFKTSLKEKFRIIWLDDMQDDKRKNPQIKINCEHTESFKIYLS